MSNAASIFSGLRCMPLLLIAGNLSAADLPRRPFVLTSFLPIHSLTLAVAGTRADVENWLPQGVDPHDFQFSPRDLQRLARADLLVIAGLGLETWKEADLREMSGNQRLVVLEAAGGLAEQTLIRDKGINPHFWLDPVLFMEAVSRVAAALQKLDEANAEAYGRSAAGYMGRLHALHREFEEGLADSRAVPFITAHNAFPYLARRYGLRLAGVVERRADEQPGGQRLADLTQLVRREGVQVLFTDARPTRRERRLASDLNLRLGVLETLETGPLGLDAYESGMRRNLGALRAALQARQPGG
jgi:zinc/manganese transport system substrate-binding protein